MATPQKEHTARSSNRSASSGRSANKDVMPNGAAVPTTGGGFKKLWFKIGEKVGTFQKTEYSPQFLDTCKEFEKYRVMAEDISMNLLRVAQQNPKCIPTPLGTMHVEAQPGQDPFEELAVAIANIQPLFGEKCNLTKYHEASIKLAKLHREFQSSGRKAIHQLRTFLSVDYAMYETLRKDLDQSRQDMDFAKHELKNAKNAEQIQAKNVVYERASKIFEEKLQKTTAFLDQYPSIREAHFKNVISFCHLEKKYYDESAKVLKH